MAVVRRKVGAPVEDLARRREERRERPAALLDEQLHRALQCVRLHGLSLSCGELQPRTCAVAAPVLGPCGTAIAALEVQVPTLETATMRRVVPALVLAARGLARELGGEPRPRSAVGVRRAAG